MVTYVVLRPSYHEIRTLGRRNLCDEFSTTLLMAHDVAMDDDVGVGRVW